MYVEFGQSNHVNFCVLFVIVLFSYDLDGGFNPQQLLSLQYVENTVIFVNTDTSAIRGLKLLLYGFELVFSFKTNFHKSLVYQLDDNEEDCKRVSCLLNCQKVEYPLIYLGILVRPNKLIHDDWFPLINKIAKRLARWKGSSLLRGGRLIMVNYVLSALPLYIMSFYQLPR